MLKPPRARPRRACTERAGAMDAFDTLCSEVDSLFSTGAPEEGLRAIVAACRHDGPGLEPPHLRDARAALLAKALLYQIYHGAGGAILHAPESALLDRRVFGWMYAAGSEAKLFPSAAGGGYDEGRDADPPLTLAAYVRAAEDRGAPAEHVRWLRRADRAVSIEIFSRLNSVNDPFHIGARVVVCGLRKATRLNGERATITSKESGGRYGVIFDMDSRANAVRPVNLTPLEQQHQGQPPPAGDATAEECAMALLYNACETLEAEGCLWRRDIAYRAEALFARGKFDAMKCGEPKALPPDGDHLVETLMSLAGTRRCHGNGKVDFVMLSCAGNAAPMREWFLSGLCHVCQKRTFDV